MILQASIFVSDLILQTFRSAEDVFTIVISNDYFQLSAWLVIICIIASLRINLINFICLSRDLCRFDNERETM